MTMTVLDAESVLTPEFARSVIRFVSLKTGSVISDDDLIQESLLRGVKAFRRVRSVEYPRAFFSKIIRDTVRDHWRRRHVVVPVEPNLLRYIPDIERRIDRDHQLARINAVNRYA